MSPSLFKIQISLSITPKFSLLVWRKDTEREGEVGRGEEKLKIPMDLATYLRSLSRILHFNFGEKEEVIYVYTSCLRGRFEKFRVLACGRQTRATRDHTTFQDPLGDIRFF